MAKKKERSEGEMVSRFGLEKLVDPTELLKEWLNAPLPALSATEESNFNEIYDDARHNIAGWNEEDLKMKFISILLRLGKLIDRKAKHVSYFEKSLSAKVDEQELSVRCDFMVAKGVMDYMEAPYFHFQEYKPIKNPTGDPMAQLLEAFLIAQKMNKDEFMPLYGAEVIGRQWVFVLMQGRQYCISKAYDCIDKDDLLKIIAVLRKFRTILDARFLEEERAKSGSHPL